MNQIVKQNDEIIIFFQQTVQTNFLTTDKKANKIDYYTKGGFYR